LREIDRELIYDYQPFGGESSSDVKTRLVNFIKELKEQYPEKNILVVTHGGIIRMMHGIYSNKEIDEIANASIHEFEI